jgi:excisionase family DNA binding protein
MKRPLLTNLTDFPFDYVTPPELATYLDCDRRTIVGMIESKALGAYQVGRNWRIPLDEARRAFPQHRKRTAR